MSTVQLKHPLTKKALLAQFADLAPKAVIVTVQRGTSEGCVDGAWSLTKLRRTFKAQGFRPVGAPDQLLFVNAARTVGLQCQGVEPHPTRNTWKTFSIEVQARSAAIAAADATDGAPRLPRIFN